MTMGIETALAATRRIEAGMRAACATRLADELSEIAEVLAGVLSRDAQGYDAARMVDALNRIAATTGSGDPCRWMVGVAREALKQEAT